MIAVQVRRLGRLPRPGLCHRDGRIELVAGGGRPGLAARPDNPEVIVARRSMPRGSIFDVRGKCLPRAR